MRSLGALQILDMSSAMATKEPKLWNVNGAPQTKSTREIFCLTEKPFSTTVTSGQNDQNLSRHLKWIVLCHFKACTS